MVAVVWILLAALAVIIYFTNNYLLNYWLRRGVAQKNPKFLIGDISLVSTSFGEFIKEIYDKFKCNKVIGIYMSYRPALILNDPELINEVLIKEFNSFHDRGPSLESDNDLLATNLSRFTGQGWRDLRTKMTPLFTSGRLKSMFPIIRDCAKVLQDYVDKNVIGGDDIFDMRDLLARFTTNIISSVAFGIENDCINERDSIFRQMGLRLFEPTSKQNFFELLSFFMPSLIRKLKVRLISKDLEEFFVSIVRQTIDYRENNAHIERKDFMQLMIEFENQGYLSADKNDEYEIEKVQKLTFNQVAAQAILFFAAGFETSSSTMNFTLFELSKNPQIQQKVHEEIDKIFQSKDINEVTYEMMNELKYLECCIDEALRKYPIAPALNRETTKEFTFKSINLTIEKGTPIIIPVMGLQRDANIYENPMEFKPERFLNSTNGNGNRKGLFYMPFGDGPRNCIGIRMGKLQTKLGLATVLLKYKFELVNKNYFMKNEIEYNPGKFFLTPKEEIFYKAIRR